MTDLIELRRVDGKVMVVSTILKNRPNSEVLAYVKDLEFTTDFASAGFDKPLFGIGGNGTYALDNSDKFFGRGAHGGIVMISHSKDAMDSYGDELYLLYDDEKLSSEKIIFQEGD